MASVLLPGWPGSAVSGPVPVPFTSEARLPRGPLRWLVAAATLAVAAGIGAASALDPLTALGAAIVLAAAACVWKWPELAGYLVIGVTPLTVGISRGTTIPLIRPNEALALLLGATLAARGLVRLRTGLLPRLRLDQAEVAMLLMALANSVAPLLWMMVRQEPISHDDLLYSLVLWKFLGLYALVRASITTGRQVRRCLWILLAAACVVAVLAILQALGLFGVPVLLGKFYASGITTGLQSTRGSSTLGLPAATADLMVLGLAVVSGLWSRYQRHRLALTGAAALFVMGALSAGEFSSAIGLLVGVFCIATVLGRPRLLAGFAPVALVAGFALRSVIARRISGFHSASGLPVSWTGRLENLRTYFWPTLFSHGNFILGVRPSARVPVPTQITGYVWIESGYTWLLWGGGIPLLASFIFFAYAAARRGWMAARGSTRAQSVAGVAVFTATLVIAVLMTFDPHLTYRGSADTFFFLLALTAPGCGRAVDPDAHDDVPSVSPRRFEHEAQ